MLTIITQLSSASTPGLTGAVAILSAEGTLEGLHDVPVLSLTVQRGTKQVYDVPGMVKLLRPYAGLHAHVFIEASQPMPGQGTRSMFTIGQGYGLWLGILATLQLPYTTVRPAVWKTEHGARHRQGSVEVASTTALPWS